MAPEDAPHHDHQHGHHRHDDHHGGLHLDEAHWQALAADAELEAEVLLDFVTGTAQWITELRGPDAPPVRRVIDIGSGPGVGSCELARLFPDAQVVAVDGSPAMLERATQRAAERGLDDRVSAHFAELPDPLESLEPADVIWASMSLHHVGDEVEALRLLGARLAPAGLLAVAEVADPLRTLPDDLDVGAPGLAYRLEQTWADWFAEMRAHLSGSVPSNDLASMMTGAGLDIVGARVDRVNIDAPLSDVARRFVVRQLGFTGRQLDERLDEDDRQALDVLRDPEDPRSVANRSDVFIDASRQIMIARRSDAAG